MSSDKIFEHRILELKNLFIGYAKKKSIIQYPIIYEFFKSDKTQSMEDKEWSNGIWNTVGIVSEEIATREGAIYDSLLANKDHGIPNDNFYDIFVVRRKHEFEQDTGLSLPSLHGMGKPQKYKALTIPLMKKMTEYERDRVYRHAAKHY
jgi:hypothetical protein